MSETAAELKPWITGDRALSDVTRDVCAPLERRAGWLWWAAFLTAFGMLALGAAAVAYTIAKGIGAWGLNRTVGWAFAITNFVFWIGIGHAGTLISAILFLFRQKWRTSVNRSAEAMTLFAVICAGMFPLIHMGRPWLAYWIVPYPNFRGPLWVNFRSALVWDFFAILTYFTVSLIFWYVGLIPDLATIRDRAASGRRKRLMSLFSLGWDGSFRAWRRYEMAYLLLAGLATPLVVSVHSIVSTDFATSIVPGWHTTIFPPYFVAGAILSGMAMVLTLMLVARKVVRLENYITPRHVDAMCKLVLLTGCLVGAAYATELFMALYSGNPYEQFMMVNRMAGPYGWAYWVMAACNVLVVQLFWFPAVRRNLVVVFVISLAVNVGMWLERFVIVVASLHRDFLLSSWTSYAPTLIEIAILIGGFGLFFTCFLLFCRALPMISMAEVKGVLPKGHGRIKEENAGVRGGSAHPGVQGSGAAGAAESNRRDLPGQPTPRLRATASRRRARIGSWFAGLVGRGGRGGQGLSRRVLLASFRQEDALRQAVREVRARGGKIADVYSPYAVHDLIEDLGWRPSRLTWVCGLCGAAGALLLLWFQFWTNSVNWPLNVGGRPLNSLPAFVPVTFEGMVLFAAIGTVAAFLAVSRLWPGKQARLIRPGLTDDRFVLAIQETDATFDAAAMTAVLEGSGGEQIEERVFDEAPRGESPEAEDRPVLRRVNIALALALAVLLLAVVFAPKQRRSRPNVEFLPTMRRSIPVPPQETLPGLPVERLLPGVVARDAHPLHYGPGEDEAQRAAEELSNPFSADDVAAQDRGRAVYISFCAACHGPSGDGDGPIPMRGYPRPLPFGSAEARSMKDGELFHVISYGRNYMPPHRKQLSQADRWKVVLYVRQLQRKAMEQEQQAAAQAAAAKAQAAEEPQQPTPALESPP